MSFLFRLRHWCLPAFVVVAVCDATVLAARGSRSEERQRECNGYGLLLAAKKGCVDRVKLLIKDDVNLDVRNKKGDNALIKTAWYGHTEIARLLIEAGAEVDVQNNRGETALSRATSRRNTEIVKLLVAAGA